MPTESADKAEDPVHRERELDDHDYQMREIYTQYGLALSMAQAVEYGVVVALLSARTAQGEFADLDDFNAAWNEHNNWTLGRLLRRLAPSLGGDSELQAVLDEALRKRNELVHRFFREHSDDFNSAEGRESMLTEFHLAQGLFGQADTVLHAQLDRYMRAIRRDPDEIRRAAEAQANRQPGSNPGG